VELLTAADYYPFDSVRLSRARDEVGEPTDQVEIEGLRKGGMRTRVVPYVRLLEQADMHWEVAHGKSRDDPQSPREFAHTLMRAAVAFLID
jgi:hypothetical protein